ncbi:MAG: carboxylesterase family protein [Pseudomonadales bacterium]|nr:carboxylesterase family protein [Pseudomonadales bacterium]
MNSYTKSAAIVLVGLLGFGCQESQNEAEIEPQQEQIVVSDEIAVTGGTIRGYTDGDGLHQFHGIPYAAPPIGDLRWAPPAATIPWQGVSEKRLRQDPPACNPKDRVDRFMVGLDLRWTRIA